MVVGSWNLAILTPAWMRKHVFGLEDDANLEVMVALDVYQPAHLKSIDKKLTVKPSSRSISFCPHDPTPDNLNSALRAATQLVDALKVTPMQACGVNLRYEEQEATAQVFKMTRCLMERSFSHFDHASCSRTERLKFDLGSINVTVDLESTQRCSLVINFDLQSQDPEAIKAWLGRAAESYDAIARDILREFEEIPDD